MTRSLTLSSANSSGLPEPTARQVARYALAPVTGGCDSHEALRASALEGLQTHYANAELKSAVERWLLSGDWARLTCRGAPLPIGEYDGDPMLGALQSFNAGRSVTAAAAVRAMIAGRTGIAAGSVAWDTRFLELWLVTQAGDSATARAELQVALRDLSGSMDHVMFDFTQTGGLRRTLALCDSLFTGSTQPSTGTKCRTAVSALSAGR